MNKSMKPSAPAARPELTEEQKKEQMMRAYLQKKASLAEGILFNLAQGMGASFAFEKENNKDSKMHLHLVAIADEMSTEFMKVVCNAELIEESEEKTEE